MATNWRQQWRQLWRHQSRVNTKILHIFTQSRIQIIFKFLSNFCQIVTSYCNAITSIISAASQKPLVGNSVGVIADPTIHKISISPSSSQQLFVVATSDGLVDRIGVDEVANHLGSGFYGGNNPEMKLAEACKQLLLEASRRWAAMGIRYRDDTSIAVKRI